jgi:hypothetical protein
VKQVNSFTPDDEILIGPLEAVSESKLGRSELLSVPK